jgi:hypothetical protein
MAPDYENAAKILSVFDLKLAADQTHLDVFVVRVEVLVDLSQSDLDIPEEKSAKGSSRAHHAWMS